MEYLFPFNFRYIISQIFIIEFKILIIRILENTYKKKMIIIKLYNVNDHDYRSFFESNLRNSMTLSFDIYILGNVEFP